MRELTDINILKSDIEIYISDYIDGLPVPDLIYENKGIGLFKGLLIYLYEKLFKPPAGVKLKHNNKSIIDYSNIDLLYDVYNVFKNICFRYNKPITLHNFALFSGIPYQTLYSWNNNNYEGINVNGITIKHKYFIDTILDDYEGCLLDNSIVNNSIGSIFALKSTRGYNDGPKNVIINNTIAGPDPEQIAAIAAARLLDKKG